MAKISVRVNLIYTNHHIIPSTYNVEWNSSKRDFESFMFDLMNTLITLEDESVFEKADILGIDIISATEAEKSDISEWKSSHDVF